VREREILASRRQFIRQRVYYSDDVKLTFTIFVIEIQCSGEMFIDDARNIAGIMSDDDAGGG
jgi:hypothetical protein